MLRRAEVTYLAMIRRFLFSKRFEGEPLRSQAGFTLIELLIVLAIIGILISIAQPNLKSAIIRAREAVLKENLFQMRDAIDLYYADNGKYPEALDDLISHDDKSRSYLRSIPTDPFTGGADWITVSLEGEESGIFDVHSASELVSQNGTPYNTW